MNIGNSLFPLVSIVLPTYNRAYILPRAIQSVFGQTYQNWELIIVDDGSIDATPDLVAGYHDARIRYIRHGTNKGLAAGRNTGLNAARADFVANLDSDDEWEAAKLEKEMAVFQKAPPNVCVVYSGYERKLARGTTVLLPSRTMPVKEGDLSNAFLEGNCISMQMAIIRKEAALRIGSFDERVEALQDWEFWLRLAPICEFRYVPEILTRGSVLPDSIAKNQQKRLRARVYIFQKHKALFQKNPSVYAWHAFTIGRAFAMMGNAAKAKNYFAIALHMRPFLPRYIVAYTTTVVGSAIGVPNLYTIIAKKKPYTTHPL